MAFAAQLTHEHAPRGKPRSVGARRTKPRPADTHAASLATATGKPLLRSLEVGASNDPLEHDADRIADRVLRAPAPEAAAWPMVSPATAGDAQAAAPPIVDRVLGKVGRPLDDRTRSYFEPRFGADLSAVRVHDDAAAGASARAVNAEAYAVGNDIVFAPGRHAPATPSGNRLLAHELAHVVQSRAPAGQAKRVRRQHTPGSVTTEPQTQRTSISSSSTVEGAKDSVRESMRRLHDQQIDAVTLLENTARVRDAPPRDIAGDIIRSVALAALDMALGGVAGAITSAILFRAAYYGPRIAQQLLYEEKAIADQINKLVSGQLKAGATALWTRVTATPTTGVGTTGLLAFFHYTRAMYRAQKEDRIVAFNNAAAQYDRMDPLSARDSLELLKEAVDRAADAEIRPADSQTYFATMVNYANMLAEASAGLTTPSQRSGSETEGAHIGWNTVGVLEIRFTGGGRPGTRPTITGARIDGLNDELRPLLRGHTIGSLGLNVRVSGSGVWASRNTGGTIVDWGPRISGTAWTDVGLNFFYHRARPSDATSLWAFYSLAGGSYGIITADGRRLQYHNISLWEDEEDHARQRLIDQTWARFRQVGWTGARLFIEEDIFPQQLPSTIEGGPSTRGTTPSGG
jgi:Domain of unknown function (DUF4157)